MSDHGLKHRDLYPEQYTHRLCGQMVKVPNEEPFIVERVISHERFGDLVVCPYSGKAYPADGIRLRGRLADLSRVSDDGEEFTDLMVLESGAGWYIGTLFVVQADGEYFQEDVTEPGSRESEYFPSKEAAQAALEGLSWNQRENP